MNLGAASSVREGWEDVLDSKIPTRAFWYDSMYRYTHQLCWPNYIVCKLSVGPWPVVGF